MIGVVVVEAKRPFNPREAITLEPDIYDGKVEWPYTMPSCYTIRLIRCGKLILG